MLDPDTALSGYGFRYIGPSGLIDPETTDLILKGVEISFENPLASSSGIGRGLQPTDLFHDDLLTGSMQITFVNSGTAAETMIEDAENSDALVAVGFGFKTNSFRGYLWAPRVDAVPGDESGFAQSGEATKTVEYRFKFDPVLRSYFAFAEFAV